MLFFKSKPNVKELHNPMKQNENSSDLKNTTVDKEAGGGYYSRGVY